MSNQAVIDKAFRDFRNHIDEEVIKQLNLICQNILIRAIRFRLSQQEGHDYTGNLINSIVVILYDEGEVSNVWTAGQDGQIKKPITRKMSARKKPYYFHTDWSAGHGTHYRAEVPTNKGFAYDDIESFAANHRPNFTKGYCISVAYTVEYADWVEAQRGTTGYLESLKFAGRQMRLSFIPLTSK